jgi:hypothetical protein
MRCRQPARSLALMLALTAVACGSGTASAGQRATATASAAAPPCAAASAAANPPIGAAQALRVIPVRVLPEVPTSAEVLHLGLASCVNVGVGQVVAVDIHARVPPLPAEAVRNHQLLSSIDLSPEVPSTAQVPQAGLYTLTFTALAVGTTGVAYLPATCTLPPGVC